MAEIQYRTDRIVFADGRRGRQRVTIYPDGEEELTEVVVDWLPDGKRCRHVYARCGSLWEGVFSLSALAPATWEVE